MSITLNGTMFTNATRIEHLLVSADQAANGSLFGLLLLGLFFILFFTIPGEFSKKILVSSWITFLGSMILRTAGLVGWVYVSSFFIVGILTYLFMMFADR